MNFFLYGGTIKNTIHSFETKSKYNNPFPVYNEDFSLQTTGDWKKIDIQISMKVIKWLWKTVLLFNYLRSLFESFPIEYMDNLKLTN